VPITIAGLWLVTLAYQFIDVIGVSLIGGVPAGALLGYIAVPLGQGTVFSLLWTTYLLRSKRVANTYRRHEAEVGEVFA
jgi:hypothetical protein